MKGKAIRGVVVIDNILKEGCGMKDAVKYEAALEEYAKGFQAYLKENHPEILKTIGFEPGTGDDHAIKAAVPMSERRGRTGSLEEIVFRGTRGDNHTKKRAFIHPRFPEKHKKRLFYIRQTMERNGASKEDIQHELHNITNKAIEEGELGFEFTQYLTTFLTGAK
jgi:hypothetical protein